MKKSKPMNIVYIFFILLLFTIAVIGIGSRLSHVKEDVSESCVIYNTIGELDSYREAITSFKYSEKEISKLLKVTLSKSEYERFIEGNQTWKKYKLPEKPFATVGEYYFFSLGNNPKEESVFDGYYVNGNTGEIWFISGKDLYGYFKEGNTYIKSPTSVVKKVLISSDSISISY